MGIGRRNVGYWYTVGYVQRTEWVHASYVCASPASAMTLLLRPSFDTRTRESKVLSISFSVSLNLSQSRLSGAADHSALNPDPES